MSDIQIAGDVEQVAQEDFVPALSGMGEDKVITVHNPLPIRFSVVFARSGIAPAAKTEGADLLQKRTGMDVSKTSSPQAHSTQRIVLEPESDINLPGDIAQIVVRKLTSYVIQTRNDDGSWNFEGHGGNKQFVPDPARRHDVENELIKSIKNTMELFNQVSQPTITQQLDDLNPKETKNAPTPDPAPGTGVNYTPAEKLPGGSGQPDKTQPGTPENPKN